MGAATPMHTKCCSGQTTLSSALCGTRYLVHGRRITISGITGAERRTRRSTPSATPRPACKASTRAALRTGSPSSSTSSRPTAPCFQTTWARWRTCKPLLPTLSRASTQTSTVRTPTHRACVFPTCAWMPTTTRPSRTTTGSTCSPASAP